MTAEQQQVLDLLKKKFFVMHFLNTEHDLAYRCLVVQPNVPYHRVDGTSREFDVDFFDQELLVSYTDAEDSQPSDEGYSYDEVTEEMLDELIDRLCPTQVVIKSEINVLIFEDAGSHTEQWDEFSVESVRKYLAHREPIEDDGFDVVNLNTISVPTTEGPHFIFIKQ